jgi:solute carrier family 10 (sodium/bile acid cotransporter), member 7
LPSTVQASVAFTSIAGGNVAAALCSASTSSILGMFLTPLLAGLALKTSGGFSLNALRPLAAEMFLPFIAGQLLQPWIGSWVQQRRKALGGVDRDSVLLVVYTMFSHIEWDMAPTCPRAADHPVCCSGTMFGLMLAVATLATRRLGFSREDEIANRVLGSKTSLVPGIPMANALFAGQVLGLIVLPLMIFHQVRLMACAALARRYASASMLAFEPEGVGEQCA